MTKNRKYYYLKLKENFFDSEDMKLLQAMKDGYMYSDILLKLYLKSLRQEGRLMYRDIIPYTPEMVATITNHQVGTVEKAMKVLEQMGFIEILDNGAIYMSDIQNFIGQSSNEGDRKRRYRDKVKVGLLMDNERTQKETKLGQNPDKFWTDSGQMSDKCPSDFGQMSGECPAKTEGNKTVLTTANPKNAGKSTLLTDANEICNRTNVGQMSRPEIEPDNNIYINNNINKTEKEKENINTFAQSSGRQASEPEADVEALFLNDGSEWRPTEALFAEYVRLYPNVDVKQQFNVMRSWCLSNPKKRKTKRGITRFINSWLAREQDKGYRRTGADSGFRQGLGSGYGNRLSELENESLGDMYG